MASSRGPSDLPPSRRTRSQQKTTKLPRIGEKVAPEVHENQTAKLPAITTAIEEVVERRRKDPRSED